MLDVIGIGALNYDCMFHCPKASHQAEKPEEGEEDFSSYSRDLITDEIMRLLHTTPYDYQFGGSSFFALKTIHAITPELKTSFVGVYSNPTSCEKSVGFQASIEDEFSFLTNREWLFYSDAAPGIALVRLNKGLRNSIKIDTGCNDLLVSLIKEKEKQHTESQFAHFLADAKWIHISSLADFNQFLFIVEKIKEAKQINPYLKASIDPGYEYTKKHRLQLKKILGLFDYIFLNENELNNLVGDSNLSDIEMYNELKSYLSPELISNVIMLKSKRRNRIIHFINGVAYSKSIWHDVLSTFKIYNDTGAGDAFAGGVIASMLSKDLFIQQSIAIKIGATAASARMTAKKNPFENIKIATQKEILSIVKNEEINNRQRILLTLNKWLPRIIELIVAILTGLLSSAIWELF